MAAAKKVEEVKEEPKMKVETAIKYRCDFKSYDEYTKYKGLKG